MKKILFVLLLFITCAAMAQEETGTRGTIKIQKKKEAVYIKASAKFSNYQLPDNLSMMNPPPRAFEPFPAVDGYSYPFNYTAFFKEKFRNININLGAKETDTVTISVKVLYNGKVTVKAGPSRIMTGEPSGSDEPIPLTLDDLQMDCLNSMINLKDWYPAYVLLSKRDTFKKQTVIKPLRRNVTSDGIITIIFSTVSFDEE